jgi:g-D-glutamyl-meso-diaminopimelate peptidase
MGPTKRGAKWPVLATFLSLVLLCAGCGEFNIKPEPTRTVAAQDAIYEVKASEYISLRKTASDDGERIAKLYVGERMRCLGFEGKFMLVEALKSGLTGYVNAGYANRANADTTQQIPGIVQQTGEDYTYERLLRDIEALRRAYPGRFAVKSLGTTADGRDIPLCIVGSETAKHKVLVTAAIHAREHMTALLAAKQMEQAAHAQSTAYGDIAFYVVPMLNPDGVTLCQLGPQAIRDEDLRALVESIMKKKHVKPSDWKSNARGVDLNRNFDVDWNALLNKGPSFERYRGETPFSEAETKGIFRLMNEVSFDVTISYHSTGSIMYWRYKQDGKLLARTGALADVIYRATGYPPATTESEEGLEGGGLKDWAIMDRGVPSLTLEVGSLSAPLNADEWPVIWQRNSSVYAALAAFVSSK